MVTVVPFRDCRDVPLETYPVRVHPVPSNGDPEGTGDFPVHPAAMRRVISIIRLTRTGRKWGIPVFFKGTISDPWDTKGNKKTFDF
jgi:hypothetical protein